MASSSRLARGLASLGLCAGALGCAAGESSPTQHVGRVADSDAVVGAVSDGEHVVLYVCGGESSFASLTHWFQGPLGPDGTFSLRSGAFTAQGDLASGHGGLTSDTGGPLSFSLAPAADPLEGLYATMDGSCRTGAVVGGFGEAGALALQGVWCDGEGDYAQVTPLQPMVLTERGIGVTVLRTPPRDLYVDRVRAP